MRMTAMGITTTKSSSARRMGGKDAPDRGVLGDGGRCIAVRIVRRAAQKLRGFLGAQLRR